MCIGICEDSAKDCQELKNILASLRKDIETMCFSTGQELLSAIQHGGHFSCLFLDIFLPDLSGVELARKIRELPGCSRMSIIFVTTSADFAVEAFSLHAVHYIIKPVRREAVREALQRVLEQSARRPGVVIRSGRSDQFVYLDEITSCESLGQEMIIHLQNGDSFSCYQTVAGLREQMGSSFLLISRGILVNAAYISKMMPCSCILKDGREILLSRKNRKEIHKDYNEYLFSRLMQRTDGKE